MQKNVGSQGSLCYLLEHKDDASQFFINSFLCVITKI